MNRKSRIALAAALLLPALPALAYEEQFTTLGHSEEKAATPVQVAGHYSEGYVSEQPAAARPQSAPVVAGNYTESFVEPGGAARAASAEALPAPKPARVTAKR